MYEMQSVTKVRCRSLPRATLRQLITCLSHTKTHQFVVYFFRTLQQLIISPYFVNV